MQSEIERARLFDAVLPVLEGTSAKLAELQVPDRDAGQLAEYIDKREAAKRALADADSALRGVDTEPTLEQLNSARSAANQVASDMGLTKCIDLAGGLRPPT